jgi:hypothetical protein
MPKKPKTTRAIFRLSAREGASLTREELEIEKTKYERQIASEFATAISDRLRRHFELDSQPLPEADERDAVLVCENGALQRIQLAELRNVDRQLRLARSEEPTNPNLDLVALEKQMLDAITKKAEHYPSSSDTDLWLVVHSSDYPSTFLMSASRSARNFLANNQCPFSVIWVFHSSMQPDAGCIEQLWPPGSESDFVRAILDGAAPKKTDRAELWRGEQMMAFGNVRRFQFRKPE